MGRNSSATTAVERRSRLKGVLSKRTGDIAVRLENGYTIFTNHLAWTDARREVTTNDAVTITGNGLEVKGRGLVGKLDVEEFQILEDVHVEIVQ